MSNLILISVDKYDKRHMIWANLYGPCTDITVSYDNEIYLQLRALYG